MFYAYSFLKDIIMNLDSRANMYIFPYEYIIIQNVCVRLVVYIKIWKYLYVLKQKRFPSQMLFITAPETGNLANNVDCAVYFQEYGNILLYMNTEFS